jgi:hypothetical protein
VIFIHGTQLFELLRLELGSRVCDSLPWFASLGSVSKELFLDAFSLCKTPTARL